MAERFDEAWEYYVPDPEIAELFMEEEDRVEKLNKFLGSLGPESNGGIVFNRRLDRREVHVQKKCRVCASLFHTHTRRTTCKYECWRKAITATKKVVGFGKTGPPTMLKDPEHLRALWMSDLTRQQIADVLHVSPCTVGIWKRKLKLPDRRSGRPLRSGGPVVSCGTCGRMFRRSVSRYKYCSYECCSYIYKRKGTV